MKKRKKEGLDTAIKMLIYPPAIAVGLLALKKKKGRKKR